MVRRLLYESACPPHPCKTAIKQRTSVTFDCVKIYYKIIECTEDVSLEAICEQMGRTPSWMPGILLRADGYELINPFKFHELTNPLEHLLLVRI